MKNPHLLLLRFSALGDVAMTVPVIRCLYKSHPNLKITFVSRPYFEPLFAEFENFKKRTAKERIDLFRNAGVEFLEAMLPILDDFDRATKHREEARDIHELQKGFDLIHSKLISILEQKGLKSMDSTVGKDFDTDFHEAITQIPSPSDDMKGKVIDETEKGYFLNDKVIRYAKVVVGQ